MNQLYLDLLGRATDSGGLGYWTEILIFGSASRSQVAYSFFASNEFSQTAGLVIAAYIAVLGRDPDFGGWQYWLGKLRSGQPALAIFNSFISSQEFQATYGSLTNTAFVTLVYQNVLNRAPDSGGLSYYVGQLNSGSMTRAQLMYSFAISQEFTSNNRARSLTNLMYLGFLRRSPEAGGEAFWINALNTGGSATAMVAGFITSPEYLARF